VEIAAAGGGDRGGAPDLLSAFFLFGCWTDIRNDYGCTGRRMEYGIIFLFFFAQGMEKNGEHRRILNERK
jgi:hypothetical protein